MENDTGYPPQPVMDDDPQLMEIMLVADQEKTTLDAVSSVDKDGEVKTVPATEENQKDFLDIGSNQDLLDILSTTYKNFLNQASDPKRFQLFKLPLTIFPKIVEAITNLFSGNLSKENEDLLSKYQITPEDINREILPDDIFQQILLPEKKTMEELPFRYDPATINFEQYSHLGISKEYLEETGLLDDMLKGHKTSRTVPITLQTSAYSIDADVQLSLEPSPKNDGSTVLRIHSPRTKPEFPFFDNTFTPQDEKILSSEDIKMLSQTDFRPKTEKKESIFQRIGNAIKNIFKKITSKGNTDFLANHLIPPGAINAKDLSTKNLNSMAQEQNAQKGQAAPAEESKSNRYDPGTINFEQLSHFGISKEYLERRGLLDDMLKGYKTRELVPISMNFGSVVLKTDARLSLQPSKNNDGSTVMAIHGVRRKPNLNMDFFGHAFSVDDKKNLRESGNMGRVIELKGYDGKYHPSIVSIDPLTNELVAAQVEKIFIPEEVSKYKLSEDEIQELRQGRAIEVEGMMSKKDKPFDAKLQLNAVNRSIEYIFPDTISERHEIGGVKLSEKQYEDYNAGKAVLVEDMLRTRGSRKGEYHDAFVHKDEVTNAPVYTLYNPDSPEENRELIIPKIVNGARLTSDDREKLANDEPVFVKGMLNRYNEEYDSFIKLHPNTGKVLYSNDPNKWDLEIVIKVPDQIMGRPITASEKGRIQDGKTILLEGMIGYDKQPMGPKYAKANSAGQINLTDYDPDAPKEDKKQTEGKAVEKKESAAKTIKATKKTPDTPRKKRGAKI